MKKDKLYECLKKKDINIEKDVFDFGIKTLITYLKYSAVIILLGVLFGLFTEVIIFMILFVPLKRFVGGFHLKTMRACFFWSVIVSLLLPYVSLMLHRIPLRVSFPIMLFCIFSTCKMGVIDHPNKRISDKYKKLYLIKSIRIEILYSLIMIVAFQINNFYIANIILLTIIFCVGGMYLQKKTDTCYNNK